MNKLRRNVVRSLKARQGFIENKKYTRNAVEYLVNAVDYLVYELMENAGVVANERRTRYRQKIMIKVSDLQQSLAKDDEFKTFLGQHAMKSLNQEVDDNVHWKPCAEDDSEDDDYKSDSDEDFDDAEDSEDDSEEHEDYF